MAHLLVLGPTNSDAPRADLLALHLVNRSIGVFLSTERDKAIALGPAGVVVPHHAGIPACKRRKTVIHSLTETRVETNGQSLSEFVCMSL